MSLEADFFGLVCNTLRLFYIIRVRVNDSILMHALGVPIINIATHFAGN